ncbi:hypothetical protein HDU76_008742 [Blyttiomyces sp. JEL0837]|nr:hypothetical protein HDU76_008742 [Blyttiomyces sp. JEL0837]
MTMEDVIKYGTPMLSNRDIHDSCSADYTISTPYGPSVVRACRPDCKVGFFTLNYINNDHNQPNQQNCFNCVTPSRISDFLWTGGNGGSIYYSVSQSISIGWTGSSFWSSFSSQVSGQYSWSETSQTGFTYTANVSPQKTCALTFQPGVLRAWGWMNYNVAYDKSCSSGTEWDWVWTEVDAPLRNSNGGEHLDGTYGLCEEEQSNYDILMRKMATIGDYIYSIEQPGFKAILLQQRGSHFAQFQPVDLDADLAMELLECSDILQLPTGDQDQNSNQYREPKDEGRFDDHTQEILERKITEIWSYIGAVLKMVFSTKHLLPISKENIQAAVRVTKIFKHLDLGLGISWEELFRRLWQYIIWRVLIDQDHKLDEHWIRINGSSAPLPVFKKGVRVSTIDQAVSNVDGRAVDPAAAHDDSIQSTGSSSAPLRSLPTSSSLDNPVLLEQAGIISSPAPSYKIPPSTHVDSDSEISPKDHGHPDTEVSATINASSLHALSRELSSTSSNPVSQVQLSNQNTDQNNPRIAVLSQIDHLFDQLPRDCPFDELEVLLQETVVEFECLQNVIGIDKTILHYYCQSIPSQSFHSLLFDYSHGPDGTITKSFSRLFLACAYEFIQISSTDVFDTIAYLSWISMDSGMDIPPIEILANAHREQQVEDEALWQKVDEILVNVDDEI